MCIRDSAPADRLCNPLAGIELVFNSPVIKEDLKPGISVIPVSYTHLRAHETVLDLVCRLLLETKNS